MASQRINDLKARVGDLRRQLAEAEERLRVAQIEESGVVIGQIVISKGAEYRVCEINARWADKPWLKGNPRKADGTFGKAQRALYGDWIAQSEQSA
jgi:hypothetical protein